MSVNLSKGQATSLVTHGGGTPAVVRMDLGWKTARHAKGFLGRALGGEDVDLDASAVLFSGHEAVDVVYVSKLTSDDGSVIHTGDDFVGEVGRNAGESLIVRLDRTPAQVDRIVFLVNSFTGQTFADVDSVSGRLVDELTGRELARFTVAGGDASTAQVVAKLSRDGAGWRLTALGVPASGSTFKELLPVIASQL